MLLTHVPFIRFAGAMGLMTKLPSQMAFNGWQPKPFGDSAPEDVGIFQAQ